MSGKWSEIVGSGNLICLCISIKGVENSADNTWVGATTEESALLEHEVQK